VQAPKLLDQGARLSERERALAVATTIRRVIGFVLSCRSRAGGSGRDRLRVGAFQEIARCAFRLGLFLELVQVEVAIERE
jgi:hypothetical protein